ncbi:unnamed protein product [Acanthoscelides obtectus]|uniref:Uncharacterized protein n=1 Tax=Acanthoscelides obtectus TaxID=200917 RepID=A0A9P0L2E6_ACAOB|nr:unnamed protein product [Acanthoscelides obtectus]CAK1637836.1 UPF0389 protein CG9231 [Acanthoscelides obtectus]
MFRNFGRSINNFNKPSSSIRSCIVRYAQQLENNHKPNNLEKKFLVWTGKYKTVDEVPPLVSQVTMERCRNRMRIKISNYMMAATALGCFAMVYLGKRAAKSGDTVVKQNIEWHKKIKEESEGKTATT